MTAAARGIGWRMTQAEIEAALAENDTSKLLQLVSDLSDALPDIDYSEQERLLRELARHPQNWIRSQAIRNLGRLAYRTRRFDAPGVIYHVVVDGLRDPDPNVARDADTAACCIAYMHGWKFPDRARRRG